IEAQLDPDSGNLEVTDVLTVRGRAALEFRLAPWLEVEGLLLDGQRAGIARAGGTWRVPLPDTGVHRVELRLRGVVPPLPPGGGRGASPSAVSGAEGSYLSGYAGWIPVTDDDWTAYRLTVEVPAPYRAVATGRLEEEILGETANRAVFAADYPAEPPALFAGPYTVRERHEHGIRMRTYFHRELDELSAGYLDDAGRYLLRFQEQIGPYPFRDFHIVSSPLPVGLGFPNLTYIGRMVLPLPFMRGRSLAHEVLHNWWGNGVAPDYAAGNWAEGLTTYMADYALAVEEGAGKALEMRLGWLRNYAALPADRDVPVTSFTSKRHDAGQVIGYDKVAFIFHMLRDELGEAVFTDGLRLFWQRQRFRVAGWSELRRAFEEVAGRNLAWFFDQWLRRTGAPRLNLGDVRMREDGNAFQVTLTIRQDSPAYKLAIPVAIDTDAGQERRRIVLDATETTATLELNARPSAVRIDPEHDLFRRLLPGEAPPILRDVTLAAEALTVIAADEAGAVRVARQLAARLLDTPVQLGPDDLSKLERAPLLIVGTTPQVEAFLARAGLDGVPDSLAGRGTARVWTARRGNGEPLLVVAVDDVQALEALLRPLPHYGGKSYLVFDGRRAVDMGTWPVLQSPLSRRLVR
ncbi:MAG: M1 family peptidase, partial [Alphaproteobacteria bacterium]|nr:M1 family peptidase [Alphaproteobacteria bacterium]